MSSSAGPPAWRRIGELATQVYALGIHQDRKCAQAPTWLAETRRRLFFAAYNQDKSISTFLGRPVRISKRYADARMPLDLSDEEVTGDEETLKAAIQALRADGWSTKGRWLRASWIVCALVISQQFKQADMRLAHTLHGTRNSRRNIPIFLHQDRRECQGPALVCILWQRSMTFTNAFAETYPNV